MKSSGSPASARQASRHQYYSATKSLCGTCKQAIDAKVLFRGGAVYLDKFCPDHGHQECMISSSVEWYLDALSFLAKNRAPHGQLRPVEKGCPFDCGPCQAHAQRIALPVVPITSMCNLDCPVCYTVNRNERPYFLSKADFGALLGRLGADHGKLDIINLTGGEPTMHVELVELLHMARAAGISRLTVSTNGLKLMDEEYVRALAAADARIVLSLDTLDDATDKALVGAATVRTKLAVLDLLTKHDVTTTLLPVVAAGHNDRDVGKLLDLVLCRPNICSLELHTIAFTGQGAVGFDRAARITPPDLHRLIADATGGCISGRDFVPSPLAHPHCYSICYLLMLDGGGYVPYTRFMQRERLFELLGDSLYLQPTARVEGALREAIDDLWTSDRDLPEKPAILSTLKRLIGAMFPASGPIPLAERQRIAERATKAVYIHSHMDEETFDVGRIMRCSVGVPEPDGSYIPTCAYNVLYREQDVRFANPAMRLRSPRALVHQPQTVELTRRTGTT